jgi:hypothetical protein
MKLSFALALLAGTLARAADPVPMDAKTGEWEYTVTTQVTGMQAPQGAQAMPAIPPEVLAQMTPDQRAKMEAGMKQSAAMMSGKPATMTNKNCIKKEDLAKMVPNTGKQQNCKMTYVTSTRSKQEIKMDCDESGQKMTGTVVVEALSPDATKFSMEMTGMQDGKPMGMKINGTGKWLSATCTTAK